MARTKCRHLVICTVLLSVLPACLNQASIEAETPTCAPSNSKAGSGSAYGLQADQQVTFYKDLLPILRTNTANKNYKCTTCHAHMLHPEGLSSVSKVEEAIDSMRKGRMPVSGARVTDAEIELFELWRLQGFQPGNPSDTPDPSDSGTSDSDSGDASPKSGNCND